MRHRDDRVRASRLVIGVRQDESFRVGDTECWVRDVRAGNRCKIEVDTGFMLKQYQVGEASKTEILSNVFVSCGQHKSDRMATLTIEAPRNVKILRQGLERHDD